MYASINVPGVHAHAATYLHRSSIVSLQGVTTPSRRQIYDPCAPSSSGRTAILVKAQLTAEKSGDWSGRLLSMTKKRKKKQSSEDVFLPRLPANEVEFEEDETEDEGPSEKRLPAEMR